MAEWSAPFHLPKFTTAEFQKMKREYIAKHGYSISVPAWDDIIILGLVEPPTPEEDAHWKAKDWKWFGEKRYKELKNYKEKRKKQFLQMLGSPTPRFMGNLGSLLTALDDVEDALTALIVAGRLAVWLIPTVLKRVLMGPMSWILTAAQTLDIMMGIGRAITFPGGVPRNLKNYFYKYGRGTQLTSKAGKYQLYSETASNPTAKKVAVAKAKKLTKVIPSKGEIVEVLQVTGQVFGFGISLGAIVGFASDMMWYAARGGILATPNPYLGLPHTPPTYYPAAKVPKAVALLMASGHKFDDETTMKIAMANYLAQQAIFDSGEKWNALDEIPGIENVEIRAPRPSNVLTVEAMEEEGYNWQGSCNWPHNGKTWAKMGDIFNEYAAPAKDWMDGELKKRDNDASGHVLGNLFTEAHFYTMANLEGADQVRYDYTEPMKFGMQMLHNGVFPNPDQPAEKIAELAAILEDNEKSGRTLSTRDHLEMMADKGIGLAQVVEGTG